MTRTAVLLSSLFVAACTVGDLPRAGGGGDGTPGIDGGTTPGIDGGPVAAIRDHGGYFFFFATAISRA